MSSRKKKSKRKAKLEQQDFMFIIAHIPLILTTFISIYKSINGLEFGLYGTSTITGGEAFILSFITYYIYLSFVTIPALIYKIYYFVKYC